MPAKLMATTTTERFLRGFTLRAVTPSNVFTVSSTATIEDAFRVRSIVISLIRGHVNIVNAVKSVGCVCVCVLTRGYDALPTTTAQILAHHRIHFAPVIDTNDNICVGFVDVIDIVARSPSCPMPHTTAVAAAAAAITPLHNYCHCNIRSSFIPLILLIAHHPTTSTHSC
jgi:CBS domain-containing protein